MRFVVVLIFSLLFSPCLYAAQQDLTEILPVDGGVKGWTRSGEAQSFKGEDLFIMIDGGADIYHEYGFRQVVSQDYSNGSGKVVTVEVYQMANPAAAYGIYSFKIGKTGESVPIGQEAFFEDYYLNIWQGDLLLTIIGSDSTAETVTAIQQMGKAIVDSYPASSDKPPLAVLLNQDPLSISSTKFVLGDLGVMNGYVFDSENILHVREGVMGELEGNQVFVLRYQDSSESLAIYTNAVATMTTGIRFNNAVKIDMGTLLTGRKGEQVMVSQAGHFIIIVIGASRDKITDLTNRIQKKLVTNLL